MMFIGVIKSLNLFFITIQFQPCVLLMPFFFGPQVQLPNEIDTLYWCKLYKVPDLAWKHQMIGVSGKFFVLVHQQKV